MSIFYIFAGNNGSGKSSFRQQALDGFYSEVVMYYLLVSDVKLNINRVKYRHQQGGHFIPTEDIIRRHKRSRDNLLKIKNEIDQLFIIDNSQRESHLIATLEKGTIIYTDDNYTDLLQSNLKL
ncbi:hypothetical protein [Oceanobacillus neutriphilus]|uniref:UDP-N-acetylglucosamine kinase n=1 Tax=Oceanobacillus neutriphilus TaxID=531815 RepID=A0ABQ2NU89_9BACI|nr:hypothetical protein [Oceanobacillus neutriphilus]GGP10641.1 hypothetical protein GCM10011346_19580 [Oceanobacillus neutriphilus]